MAYQCQIYETPLPMDTNLMGFHMELGIRNFTGEKLIIMLPNGSTYRVDPISQFSDPNPRVHVESIIRDHYNHVYNSTLNGKNNQQIATVTLDVLQNGPIPLTEFNLTLALEKYAYLLPEFNIFSKEYYNQKVMEAIKRYWNEPGYGSPIFIVGNCYNVGQEYLYMVVNDTILQYKLVHNFEQTESLDIYIQAYNGWRKMELPDLKWDKLNTSVRELGDSKWMISTNYELLAKWLADKRAKEASKMSKDDADLYIKARTSEYTNEISSLKDQISNCLREIDILRKALSNSEYELKAANEGARRSYEQHMYELKGRNLDREAELMDAKRMFSREQDILSERQRSRKAESELEIARAKVAKEKYGLESAHASNAATYAKAASVLIPAVIGVGVWAAKSLSSVHPVGALAGASAYGAYKLFKPAVSVVKNTWNTVSNAVKSVWSWIRS